MQIKWLEKALKNVDEEASYITKSDPKAALIVVQRIYDTVNLLCETPALGHSGRIHGTRELIVPDTRYIIPYRVKPDLQQVQILRVFHGSRKSPKRW
jgi:toxin ParE1/3/4